ncbi:sensor histidine kinase [Sediminitomix flava]|uniref:Histidine kinase n=1 Tax=Sediminitomix flava TaxID=379075 RepID=A0A316A2B4_SEDFL|nr:histidine kinase [Sediminitomix flava]PWJ43837.1 histidine kinase [Sediminitomix flava]
MLRVEDFGYKELYSLKEIGKRFLLSTFWTGVSFYAIKSISGLNPPISEQVYFLSNILCLFLVLNESVILIEFIFESYFPISVENVFKRMRWQGGVNTIVFLLIFSAMYHIVDKPENLDFFKEVILFLGIGLWAMMLQVSITLFARLLNKWKKLNNEVESLKVEKMEMSIKALQDQINPHFLFNNLSILKSFVMLDEKEKALNFVQDFSDIYRYVLKHSNVVTVTLEEELKFINHYISLHQERLEEGLEVSFDIKEEDLWKTIPPMTLQLLVENAIKHNIADAKQVLHIFITSDNDQLTVSNNIQLKQSTYSTQLGLVNLKRRFEILSGRSITIEQTNGQFIVAVPLLDE